MPDFLQMMRLKNLFGNNQLDNAMPSPMLQGGSLTSPTMSPYNNVSFGSTEMPMPQPQNDFDPARRMAELYTPEHEASDRFNNLINQFPQEQKPSGLRRVGGAILGSLTDLGTNFGGNRTGVKGHDVYDETTGKNKYRESVGKWKEQVGPSGTAASLEKGNNINERQLASQTVNSELTARRDDARNKTNESNTKIREDRAAVYRYKVEHPNKKFDFTGPTVLLADPNDGSVVDTGIKTGSLSDEDKINLQQTNAINRIKETGNEARKTEDTRETNRENLAGVKGDETRKTKGTPSANLTNKGETPTQTKVRQYNTAKEFAAKNPNLAKFIKFGKSNEFTVSPPSQGGFFSSAGPTEEEHNAITNAIYGDALQVPQPTRTGSDSNTNTPTDKPNNTSPIKGLPPEGKIKVSNDGGKTKHWLPFKQFEAAKKQGYVQVQ